ncbi:MAG TPA: M48 family metalloprotease [Chitinophagaceae bacterium]|nr:M48 family metalloprotease [Chitinophagaceae bacterium]
MFPLSKILPLSFLCALLFSFTGMAQNNFVYTPLSESESFKKSVEDALLKRFNDDINSLSSSKYKKEITAVYKERYELLKKYATEGRIVSDSSLNNYIGAITNEITNANPELKSLQMLVLVCTDYWPNAFCFGEGTILFNIGLLNRLDNEAEMAFVICHEMAHQYFKHSNTAISTYFETINSKEFQQKLKEIKESEYGKRAQTETLVKKISFTTRRHSRDHEAQADSMALVWLQKTRFNAEGATGCLTVLDTVDKDKYDTAANPKLFFNFPEYPFQQSWEKNEQSFFSKMAAAGKDENKGTEDSLKTHPDCKKRIELLQAMMPPEKTATTNFAVYDSSRFALLKLRMDYEILESSFRQNRLSRSLYYTLQMMQYFPHDAYLTTHVGRCLNEMYAAQKNHTLGTKTDLPSEGREKNYNDFLEFIQKLRLNDFGNISYYFMRLNAKDFGTDNNFMEAFNTARKNIDK